ncbi:hypothetical protein MMC18_001505 [Xylographa bjoerkii]|nr:hypothetical protein [Xylographa bjoerkii]
MADNIKTFRAEVRALSQSVQINTVKPIIPPLQNYAKLIRLAQKRKAHGVPVVDAAQPKISTFAVRSRPTTLLAQSNGFAVPASTSPEPHSQQKRVSIDLTISDDDDEDGTLQRPPSKQRKTSHTSCSASEEDLTVPSSGVQVVIQRKTPTAHSRYAERLSQIPGPPVTLFNNIDDSTPPTNFEFIDQYVFGPGTKRVDKEFRSGCTCYQDSREAGCSSLSCECLEDTAIGENGKSDGFAYYGSGPKTGLLRYKYLKTRNAIYECNELCSCNDNCKSRVVQKGRQIPLDIFKTRNRGWGKLLLHTPNRLPYLPAYLPPPPGLRSPSPIRKGQFIDTYLGEVLTDADATRREASVLKGKDSYLYSLDKFRGLDGEPGFLPDEELYVVDGQFMGGPTRFINHSCEPNCRQFTVSNVRGDTKVYALAFFALEDIPAWTELTFDYVDREEEDGEEEEEVNEGNVEALERERDKQATKCLCGARGCRKYLWL